MAHPIEHFDLLTLTYKPYLDILLLDLQAKILVRMSVRLTVRVVTHTHTDMRCQNKCD